MGAPIQTYHISITNSKQKHKRQKVNFLCRIFCTVGRGIRFLHPFRKKMAKRRGGKIDISAFLRYNTYIMPLWRNWQTQGT